METQTEHIMHLASESRNRFGWVDYLLFALSLLVTVLIGVYHAWRGAGNSTSQYLLGGKAMGMFPIAMSLAASVLSANAMVGVPTDVYLTGTMHWWMVVAVGIGCAIGTLCYSPVFSELGIVSINQYLELRFNHVIRRMSSLISIIQMVIYLAIVAYGPSLVLAQVTGLNVYLSCGVTFVVCTFYTAIGGMKAVVWTDTVQIFLMVGSVTVLVIKTAIDVGIDNVWQRNIQTRRIEFFNVDPDPTTEKTIWSMVIGGGFFWISAFGTGQGCYQRYLSLPTRVRAQSAMVMNIAAVTIFITFCCATGLMAYAKYFDCDPLMAKVITKADQIIPYFVMDVLGDIPGLPGFFVAGVFSASLSTLSTLLNVIGLIILEDFIRPFYPNMTDVTATRVTKSVSTLSGVICFGLVFLVSNIKTIMDAGLSMNGAGFGVLLGVFTLGLLVPWANSTGAGIGMVVSWVSMMALGMATQMAKSAGSLVNEQAKPRSIQNCSSSNLTNAYDLTGPKEEPFVLLKLSYMWYTMMGTFIVITIGTLASFLSGSVDPGLLDPKLVFRFIRRRVGWKRDDPNSVEVFTELKDHHSPM